MATRCAGATMRSVLYRHSLTAAACGFVRPDGLRLRWVNPERDPEHILAAARSGKGAAGRGAGALRRQPSAGHRARRDQPGQRVRLDAAAGRAVLLPD